MINDPLVWAIAGICVGLALYLVGGIMLEFGTMLWKHFTEDD